MNTTSRLLFSGEIGNGGGNIKGYGAADSMLNTSKQSRDFAPA
jgi:hypothetical protein